VNFGTFFICKPEILVFRLLGFGAVLFDNEAELATSIHKSVWAVPVFPGFRFGFLAP
jgi:hypothetical protein